MMKKRISCILALQAFLTVALAIPMSMASTSTYYLDASRLEIAVSPTTNTASGMVKVSSNSNRPIRLKVIPKLWQLTPQGVVNYIDPPLEGYNLLENLSINPEEFELQPGKSRLVRFLVKVPPTVKDAEYPFQLYFQPASILEPSAQSATAGVNNQIDVVPVFTTTVYVYQGKPVPAPQVTRFQCGYHPERKQLSVDLAVENQGSKHARLFGNALITPKSSNSSGNAAPAPIDVLHLQNSMLIITFPGTPRTVQEQLPVNKKLDAGQYQMELQLVDERNAQPAIHSTCDFTVESSNSAIDTNKKR